MAKTMKQIADEIGIDKQRVYRYIKKNHINEAHQKNGVMYYNEAAERLIKQEFSEKEVHQGSASSDAVIDVLLKQSEMLKKELEAKDKQIESLHKSLERTTEALASAQESLKVAQLLQANAEQRVKLLEQAEESATEETGKKPWWKVWK